MALFVRKNNLGAHSFRAGGKKVRVKPGELVECTKEEIGDTFISEYVELTREETKQKRQLSPLKLETDRFYELRRLKSWILNPNFKAGPGQIFYTPKDVIGLKSVLYDLEQEEIHAHMELKEAWLPWKLQCKADPMGEKVILKPEGIYVEAIARATARHKIAKDEKSEILARIEALGEKVLSDVDQKRKRLFMRGFLRNNRDGQFREVDGFAVEYRSGKPFIPEKNISLREYLDQIKEHKKAAIVKKRAKRKDPAPIVTA